MNFNKAIIAGNLTRDPEVRAMPSGQNVVNFGVATNRVWNDQSGTKQEAAEFHNVVAFGKLADICARYLSRGRLVLIEGRIQTRSWQGQDGQKRTRTEIVAENMQMGPRGGTAEMPSQNRPTANPNPAPTQPVPQEDIPIIDAEEDMMPAREMSQPVITDSEDEGEINVKDIPF